MLDINTILTYLDRVASDHLVDAKRQEILDKIGEVRCKQNDNRLYLALVGEFSSGKSTFINALLGYRLLKEAVRPTTACATYIQATGNQFKIDVCFFDGKKISVTDTNYTDLSNYLTDNYDCTINNIQQVIDRITSDQNIAKNVSSLNITLPKSKIPENIVIIDTPGFNPGSASVGNHFEITRNVVENIADVALILTPQEQAMSASLINFLKDSLKHCLHRCSFVITKVDDLQKEHWESILQYVKSRIAENLNVDNGRVYMECAISVLPVVKIPDTKKTDWPLYQEEFKKFETTIWGELQRCKDILISEHVLNLIKVIVDIITESIKNQQDEFKKTRDFLSQHRVESIQVVCDKMVLNSINAIDTSIGNIPISFEEADCNSKVLACDIINQGVISNVRFKDFMIPEISKAVESESSQKLSSINTLLNDKVKDCVEKEIAKMRKVFVSHYKELKALPPVESAPEVNLVQYKTPSFSFEMAISKIDVLTKKENTAAGWGAVIGGGIGFLLGGPIGAGLGAFFGLGGGASANDKSDEMRVSAKSVVRSEITSFFSDLRTKVEMEILRIKNEYVSLIKRFAQNHIKIYEQTVNKLIENHEQRKKAVDSQLDILKTLISNLDFIKDNIIHDIAVLKIQNQ